jgi:protein involved in polysaccharide export with SLBB domain
MTGVTPEQLRGLLAHELAHVRRLDYAANLLQSAIETLLFYNPAAWWIGRIIRQERENCCDDIAAAVCDRAVYAKALVSMERLRQLPMPALSARGGSLLSRVSRLLQPAPRSPAGGRSWITAAALLVVIVAVVAMPPRRARAQEAVTNNTNPSSDDKGEYYISGVPRSGVYALAGSVRHVRQALVAAGFHDDPSGKIITLIRRDQNGQETRQTLDMEKVYADADGEMLLQDNDVLLVQDRQPLDAVNISGNPPAAAQPTQQPSSPEYVIEGDIPRAGVYSLQGRDVSVLEALIAAGADPTRIKSEQLEIIRRTTDKTETKYNFGVDRVLQAIDPPFILQSNDIVYVHPSGIKPAHFVRLVVGIDQMTFEGQPVLIDNITGAVLKMPDLSDTVFQVARESDKVTLERLDEAMAVANLIVQKYGLKYVDEIGVHPLGTKGGDETTGAPAKP